MMNNEELERTINFIVTQQAQFASDIQQLQESQKRTEKVVAQTSVNVSRTADTVAQITVTVGQVVDVVANLANVMQAGFNEVRLTFSEVDTKINALVDAQIRNEEQIARNEERSARTEANVARTDEALRNFIAETDRRSRNGKKGSS